MEFQEAVRTRRMVRSFEDRPIPYDVVGRILANAQRGPSSGFTQGFEFLVFHGPEQTSRFWQAVEVGREPGGPNDRPDLRCAPLIVVPFAHEQAYVERYLSPDKTGAGRRSGADFPAPYWFIDSGMAAMLILLTAVDAGLGGFYFSVGPNSRAIPKFCAALDIPAGYHPVGAIAVGYPAPSDPHSPSRAQRQAERRPPGSVLHLGAW